ncbi:MAG: hypothetical protein GY719_27160 [bacterium]|nr:hypothetical protein [bacterium]
MIGELLGHRQTSTTERYSHLSRDPKKGAAESIAATLAAALGEGGDVADVVTLKAQEKPGYRSESSTLALESPALFANEGQ